MKKSTLGIAAAGLTASLGAYAAFATGAAPFEINVPNMQKGLEFNLSGLYLRPTNCDLDYVTVELPSNGRINDPTTRINTYAVRTSNNFAFHLGAGYVFANSGNDIQVGWTHFNDTSSDIKIIHGNSVQVSLPYFKDFIVRLQEGDVMDVSGTADFKYDAVDLDVGQYMNIGTRLSTRLFAGIRYARITRDLATRFIFHKKDGVTRDKEFSDQSKFHGFGPRFGVHSVFHVGRCIGLVGEVSAALLVSKLELGEVSREDIDNLKEDIFRYHYTSVQRVVPNVEGRLGLDYSYAFGNTSSFAIEAGYHVTTYFEAVDRAIVGDQSKGETTADRRCSNVSFDGPYLSLNLKV